VTHDADYWQAMNRGVIADFRANDGVVKRRKHPLLLLTTKGARSGREHVTPLNYSRDGERVVVIASKGGSATHPDWYRNIVAHPEVQIEDGTDTYRARATVAQEPERTRLYDQQVKQMSFFDSYRKRVKSREIPVVLFERIDRKS
jgi:deazaflavin-dependent oxidoreductase (nitroreductase family)